MDSGRIHLPPIQDMLCRRLSFTEESPISPVSSTCSSNSSSHITHKSPSPTTDTYLHWEQRSAYKYDQDMRQHVGYTQLDSGKYNGTYPLHHSRSYSDPFLPRKSSACSITSKHVVDQASLQVNNHNNNRYKCNQCLKSFSRPSSLRIHILSHTGEKPHVCPQAGCGRRFSVQSNMRRHLKVHYCNTQPGYLGRLQHLK